MREKAEVEHFGIRNGRKDVLLAGIPNHRRKWKNVGFQLFGKLQPAAIDAVKIRPDADQEFPTDIFQEEAAIVFFAKAACDMDVVAEHDGFSSIDDGIDASEAAEDNLGRRAWKLVFSDNKEGLVELDEVFDALAIVITLKIFWKTHKRFSSPDACMYPYGSGEAGGSTGFP